MSEPNDLASLFRAIGRMEGNQRAIDLQNKQIIEKLNAIIVDAVTHQQDDRRDFQGLRDLMDRKLEHQRDQVDGDQEGQDVSIKGLGDRVTALEKQNEREKGAGWVVLGLLTALASILGSALLSVFSGHITVKLS